MKRLPFFLVILLACCSGDQDPPWLGYGEGEDVFVAAPAPGWVTQVAIRRGQLVRAGDLLFTLDDTRERAARDSALANLAAIRAQRHQNLAALDYTSREFSRQGRLMRVDAGTQDLLDLARSNYDQNRARLSQSDALESQAQATLRDAEYQLSERRIVAKVGGRVDDLYFRAGEYVPPTTPVVSLLPRENVYVRFFVPEEEFARIRVGRRVRISCDGCDHDLDAVITFIAAKQEFTPPVIFSLGNREKLVFKLEARAPKGLALNPGEPVEVRPL